MGNFPEVKVEQRLCVFLDILGFKNIVREDEGVDEACAKVVAALKSGLKSLDKALELDLVDVKSFSDNVLISLKYEVGKNFIAPLFEFVCGYQKVLLQHGYFVRGGMSLGGLYVDEYAIYGQALIDAYDIESDKAIYPIVMLSQDVLEFAKRNKHLGLVSQVFNHRNFLSYVFEFREQFFVNYLRSAFISDEVGVGVFPKKLDVDFIEHHRNIVVLNMKKHSANERIFSKYLFLAAYHNEFCDACNGVFGYRDDLKISSFGYAFNFVEGF